MKVIIIGGVAGGATAAARLRRLNEKAEIVIYERTGYISYANCGLPYYIGDVIENENNLTLQTPKSFFNRFNIVVKVKHEVIEINKERKEVKVLDLENNVEFIDCYDKLILSPGAKPIIPNFINDINNVFTLRTVEDTFRIKRFISDKKCKSAVIIGGGYIGLEMAENLVHLGIDVTVIEKGKSLFNIVDNEISSFIHAEFRSKGVNLYLETEIKKLSNINNQVVCLCNDGLNIKVDLVILGIGVTPENRLAEKCGLKLSDNKGIIVNEKMQTSNENIYAVGDVTIKNNLISNEEVLANLAGPANKQGHIAADNICGFNSSFKGVIGTSIIKLFDMTVASCGINERKAIELNLEYEKIILSPSSRATYYPGSKVMTIKVLYEKNSLRILGAQIAGYDGIDKRIDVLSTAIYGKLKITDLQDLELAYAPPYSSAKDPINLIGYISSNIENGLVKQFYYENINELRLRKDVILLDTRTIIEYNRGHAEGFINIPLDELRNRLNELDVNKEIYIMCQSGLRSYIASRILNQYGYISYNFAGGFRVYNSIFTEQLLSKEAYECGIEKQEVNYNKNNKLTKVK